MGASAGGKDEAALRRGARALRRSLAPMPACRRILDGHLNAVERLARAGAAALAGASWRRSRPGGCAPGSGARIPARRRARRPAARATVSGVKTFCSGAGGLQRALVLVRHAPPGPRLAAWLDLTGAGDVEIDRTWFRGAGMRSSASHRVIVPQRARARGARPARCAGPPPWFARDAVRTAATWAGAADAAVDDALDHSPRARRTELEALAAGRLSTWQRGSGCGWRERRAVLDGGTAGAAQARGRARARRDRRRRPRDPRRGRARHRLPSARHRRGAGPRRARPAALPAPAPARADPGRAAGRATLEARR